MCSSVVRAGCGALVGWQVFLYSLPLAPGVPALDWRYHAVWLYPLVLTALAPFLFHPYLIGGRDHPLRRAPLRIPGADTSASPTGELHGR